MEDKARCQSCGMPIDQSFGNLGTEADGSSSKSFCSFCYKDGGFTIPDQTLEEMIQSSIDNMTADQNIPLKQATELANSFIPKLGRWQQS